MRVRVRVRVGSGWIGRGEGTNVQRHIERSGHFGNDLLGMRVRLLDGREEVNPVVNHGARNLGKGVGFPLSSEARQKKVSREGQEGGRGFGWREDIHASREQIDRLRRRQERSHRSVDPDLFSQPIPFFRVPDPFLEIDRHV